MEAPFKIYADFECILRPTSSEKVSDKNGTKTQKNIKIIFCAVLPTKLFLLLRKKMKKKKNAYKFIEAVLKEYDYCKRIMKKHFNKNLVMSAEEEED